MPTDALGRFGAASVVADHDTDLRDCPHLISQIRWRTQSNGVRQAWRQCLRCFQTVGSAVKHADAPSDAPSFDEQKRNEFQGKISAEYSRRWQEQQAERDAQFNREREQRRQVYWEYLQSIEWRRKREAVLERDNYQCKAQLPDCTGRASQAHHLTYERIFDEPLFDLISVCRSCHERLHAKYRNWD